MTMFKRTVRGFNMALLLAAMFTFASACGASWQDVGRHGIETGAVIVDTGDSALVVAVHADCSAAAALFAPGSDERSAAVDACLHEHHYDVAIDAVHSADRALRAAQAAMDAADHAHERSGWLGAAACLVVSVAGVVDALAAAEVHLPTDVLTALTALRAFSGTCAPPGGTP